MHVVHDFVLLFIYIPYLDVFPGLHTFIAHSPKFKFCTAYDKSAAKAWEQGSRLALASMCVRCVGCVGCVWGAHFILTCMPVRVEGRYVHTHIHAHLIKFKVCMHSNLCTLDIYKLYVITWLHIALQATILCPELWVEV